MSEDAGWVLQLVHSARLAELAPELKSARITQPEKHLRDRKNHLERVPASAMGERSCG